MCEAGNCVCDQDHIQSTGLTAFAGTNSEITVFFNVVTTANIAQGSVVGGTALRPTEIPRLTFLSAKECSAKLVERSAPSCAGQLRSSLGLHHSDMMGSEAVKSSLCGKRNLMADLGAVVAQLKVERAKLDKAIEALSSVAGKSGGSGKRRLSPAARERIAAAQRARWAKFKAKKAR
jgi:hypothetical protein